MAISSIFNDVIGPVMRGPSSSHSAAACRMGLMLRDFMEGDIKSVVIDYDPSGSLVTTHESQGTDMGLYGGLLGWEAHDKRMPDYKEAVEAAGIGIKVNYLDYGAKHPNTYRINISNDKVGHSFTGISTGGGMLEVQEIDGSSVSMNGDFHELLIYGNDLPIIKALLPEDLNADFIEIHQTLIEVKSAISFHDDVIDTVRNIAGVERIRYLKPVLPVLSRKNMEVPFLYCKDMLEMGKQENLSLWELALRYESVRGNFSEVGAFEKMREIVRLMTNSVQGGLMGTEYHDRILPCQSLGFKDKMDDNKLLEGDLLNTIILYVTAIMEMKSSMGIIVAAPTAGSCGTLPGTILGAAAHLGKNEDDIVKAMLASGIMGVFIAEHSTFSAEVGGCQAETGAGGSMAAAGLIALAGGTLDQAVAAASIALQNSLGIICDPIGVRVEAPCLGKNVMAASNALSCANMALANYDHLIAYDEVVDAMFEVGNAMPHEHRCTGLGGLAATPTAREWEKKLNEKMKYCG